MSVISISGVPGSGKTLFATYLVKNKFKKENRFRHFRPKINNVFSNYPVKLTNKKIKRIKVKILKDGKKVKHYIYGEDKNIYSRKTSLLDFKTWHNYLPDSIYILDEFHTLFDSLDYKNFPKEISKTFQFHRHFGVKDIYVIAQHPSRLVKPVRILIDEFYHIRKFIKIPFLGIGIFSYVIYYNFDDYNKSVNVDPKEVNYDFKKKIKFVRYKRLFNSYDTKYMKVLVQDKPYYETDTYNSKTLTKSDIKDNFGIES